MPVCICIIRTYALESGLSDFSDKRYNIAYAALSQILQQDDFDLQLEKEPLHPVNEPFNRVCKYAE